MHVPDGDQYSCALLSIAVLFSIKCLIQSRRPQRKYNVTSFFFFDHHIFKGKAETPLLGQHVQTIFFNSLHILQVLFESTLFLTVISQPA